MSALFLIAALFIMSDSFAQWGRSRYDGRGGYYGGGPRVSIGIGGIFGFGRYGGYYGGPGVGVSVMLPPIVIGSRINSLPPGARRVYLGGIPYYYRGNTYYRERERGGYEVVEAPLGAIVDRLPAGARQRIINGETFYEYGGTYFQREGEREYVVVGTDGRLDTEEARRRMQENDSYDDRYNDDVYRNDNNRYGNPSQNNGEVKVRNANEDPEYTPDNRGTFQKPEIGDRFDILPKNSRLISSAGTKQYVSPNGIYYKEVMEDGRTVYEVVRR